jgi:rhodanese-related sulfurtransferase
MPTRPRIKGRQVDQPPCEQCRGDAAGSEGQRSPTPPLPPRQNTNQGQTGPPTDDDLTQRPRHGLDQQQRVKEIAAAFPEPPVYVVCRSGVRSAQITAYLLGIGLDAVNVEGGMESWVADGRRLVAETSSPPQVL